MKSESPKSDLKTQSESETQEIKKSESLIQQQIVRHYWNTYCLPIHEPRQVIFHIPNQNQHRLTNIGVLAGVSDLMLTYKGIWHCVEVKEPGKGKQSDSQVEFENTVTKLGTSYDIVTSLEEFKILVEKWKDL